jgi:hypothetical protein
LSLYVSWSVDSWRFLPGVLDDAKKAAQEDSLERFLKFDNGTWEVSSTGRRSGGGFGPVYAWQLRGEGVAFSIARQQFPKGDMPNVLVSLGSLYLMTSGGLLGGYNFIREVIEFMGGTIEKHVLSRVDPAVDIAGVDVSLFSDAHLVGRRVQWATSNNLYHEHGKVTGLQIGKGDIVLRIYDKISETRNNKEKREYLINERWGGELPEKAIRVEFQIRRDALKDFGITTIEDYAQRIRGVLKYLTEKWFRLTQDVPAAGHVHESISDSLWSFVSSLFDWSFSEHEFRAVERVRNTKIDAELLKRQGVGCFLSVLAANYSTSKVGADNIEGLLVGLVRSALQNGHTLLPQFTNKRLRYESRFPRVI